MVQDDRGNGTDHGTSAKADCQAVATLFGRFLLERVDLHSGPSGGMNVLTAAIAAKRRISTMTNSTTPAPVDVPAKDTDHMAKATKTARATQPRTHVAPSRAKPARKAARTRPAGKSQSPHAAARGGSKTAKILDLLKRPGGASLKELRKTTGWQAHSVRGFISGALRKKMGLRVRSFQRKDGERAYAVSSK